jgi:putative endonuclease
MASKRNGTLYTGITSCLPSRIWQHKQGTASKFTAKYYVSKLVYFEPHKDINVAIAREKAIKNWKRAWKIELIEANNPGWRDLFGDIAQP